MIVHGWCVPFLTQDHIYQKCGYYNTHIWRNGIFSNICWNLKLTTISHKNHITIYLYMDVSKNRGTQQAWVFLPKLIILWCLGVPHLRKHPILLQINQTKKTTRKLPNYNWPLPETSPHELSSQCYTPQNGETWWNLRKNSQLEKNQKKNNETPFFSGISVPNFHRSGCFSYTRNSPACNISDGCFSTLSFSWIDLRYQLVGWDSKTN